MSYESIAHWPTLLFCEYLKQKQVNKQSFQSIIKTTLNNLSILKQKYSKFEEEKIAYFTKSFINLRQINKYTFTLILKYVKIKNGCFNVFSNVPVKRNSVTASSIT